MASELVNNNICGCEPGQCVGTLVTRGGVRGQARDGRGHVAPAEGGHQVAPEPIMGSTLSYMKMFAVCRQLSQLLITGGETIFECLPV